jgi:hypothetical protein
MLLNDLPAKILHPLLRSITWTEVEVAFPIRKPLRRFVSQRMRQDRSSGGRSPGRRIARIAGVYKSALRLKRAMRDQIFPSCRQ